MNKNIGFGLMLIMLGLWSCKTDNKATITPEADCTSKLPETVSYANHVQPIFSKNCATSGCHQGADPAGGLNLEAGKAYAEISKKGSGYIDTLQPQYSVLVSSMLSTTNPMPPNGKLDQCDIELIKKWMLQKAKNN
jgi:mono/diheme cytochrome c family protein